MITRRRLLVTGLALPFAAHGQERCGAPTPADIEGPFYKSGASLRANFVEAASTAEKMDVKGRPYMVLPRPNPVDCYYLHNPDGYYRAE